MAIFNENLPRVCILAGPTAVGKTNLSLSLARNLCGEIISADSAQVYKYMDIGTAKITRDEMQGIKHYMILDLRSEKCIFDLYHYFLTFHLNFQSDLKHIYT
mgnify:CR=1 FL=1